MTSGRRLSGEGVSPERARGTTCWFATEKRATLPGGERADQPTGTQPTVAAGGQPSTGDVERTTERARFERARAQARAEVRADREQLAATAGADAAAVFDAHAQFLDDPELVAAVEDALDLGLVAEHAVQVAVDDAITEVGDRYAADLQDIRRRLLRVLRGRDPPVPADLPTGTVVLAERLRPSDTVALDLGRIAGIATVAGGRTAHASIVARSLGIPAVVGIGESLRDVPDGVEVQVAGCEGVVVVDPEERAGTSDGEDEAEQPRLEPATTTDCQAVRVAANAGTTTELETAAERGADGVGLFRTEMLFLQAERRPTEADLYEAYVSLLDAFPDERVVVRTLDVGDDKVVPAVRSGGGGPLGGRGIQLSLGPNRDLFERQLRALVRAAAAPGGDLGVMFPMVASVEDFEQARGVLRTVLAELADEGVAVDEPAVGTMVETPAATMVADELADRAEFLSVGTNDLIQYLMAAARDDESAADRHDPLGPPVLRAVDRTTAAAERADVPVSVCGEMAGDPSLAPLLLGLGVDELSVPPGAVQAVKNAVATTDHGNAAAVAERAVDAPTREAVAELVEEL